MSSTQDDQLPNLGLTLVVFPRNPLVDGVCCAVFEAVVPGGFVVCVVKTDAADAKLDVTLALGLVAGMLVLRGVVATSLWVHIGLAQLPRAPLAGHHV